MPEDPVLENGAAQDVAISFAHQRIRIVSGVAASHAYMLPILCVRAEFFWASPEVELCGYSIPHPAEAKMNLRIQTYDGTTVYDALEKGFKDLMDLCDVVTDKFEAARHQQATEVGPR
ncbi:MAG: hypothetical protein Q9167_004966 [Letrouitia subvulpina]